MKMTETIASEWIEGDWANNEQRVQFMTQGQLLSIHQRKDDGNVHRVLLNPHQIRTMLDFLQNTTSAPTLPNVSANDLERHQTWGVCDDQNTDGSCSKCSSLAAEEPMQYLTMDRVALVRKRFIPIPRDLTPADLDAYTAFCQIERAIQTLSRQ